MTYVYRTTLNRPVLCPLTPSSTPCRASAGERSLPTCLLHRDGPHGNQVYPNRQAAETATGFPVVYKVEHPHWSEQKVPKWFALTVAWETRRGLTDSTELTAPSAPAQMAQSARWPWGQGAGAALGGGLTTEFTVRWKAGVERLRRCGAARVVVGGCRAVKELAAGRKTAR